MVILVAYVAADNLEFNTVEWGWDEGIADGNSMIVVLVDGEYCTIFWCSLLKTYLIS